MLKVKYVYPAIVTPVTSGAFDVKIFDLPGCRTCGKNLAEAIFMAEDAMAMWLWDAEVKGEAVPDPTPLPTCEPPQFTRYITADIEKYQKKCER